MNRKKWDGEREKGRVVQEGARRGGDEEEQGADGED